MSGSGDSRPSSTPRSTADGPGGGWLGVAVWLIALHSYGVGLILLGLPDWSLQFGGFVELPATFFVRQGGVFHLVVATGYLLEYRRHGSIDLLLVAKATATAFLLGTWLLGITSAWSVPLAAVGDGLMGLVAWQLSGRRR